MAAPEFNDEAHKDGYEQGKDFYYGLTEAGSKWPSLDQVKAKIPCPWSPLSKEGEAWRAGWNVGVILTNYRR